MRFRLTTEEIDVIQRPITIDWTTFAEDMPAQFESFVLHPDQLEDASSTPRYVATFEGREEWPWLEPKQIIPIPATGGFVSL